MRRACGCHRGADIVRAGGAGLAFKKIDSLLRGQEAAEVAQVLALLKPAHCIVAPAFPAQGRVTLGGRQFVQGPGGERPVPGDLSAQLEAVGLTVSKVRIGHPVPVGISLWDAGAMAISTPSSRRRRICRMSCGSEAQALLRPCRARRDAPWRARRSPLPRPILGLIGSEHDVIRQQLARLGSLHRRLDLADAGADDDIAARLIADGAVFASVDLSAGTPRRAAAALIESRFAALLAGLGPPGTLLAAGGETLRGLCEALGADHLDVVGEIIPGVPRSILRGGRWDGVTVVSKSGAFGGPDLLKQLVAAAPAALAGAAA